jgi:hypothetical protein
MNDAPHVMSSPSNHRPGWSPKAFWQRTGVRVGIAGMVLGFVAFGVGFASALGGTGDVVDEYQRVDGPTGTVEFAEAGRHYVFVEFIGASQYVGKVSIPDTSTIEGEVLELTRSSMTQRYDAGGHSGILIGQIDAPAPGPYRVSGGEDGVTYAFGRETPVRSGIGGFVVILLGSIVGFAGFVTLVVASIRWWSDRRISTLAPPPYAGPA